MENLETLGYFSKYSPPRLSISTSSTNIWVKLETLINTKENTLYPSLGFLKACSVHITSQMR